MVDYVKSQDGDWDVPPEPRREPVFNMPGVVLAFIGLCAGIHLLSTAILSDEQFFELWLRFAFIPLRYTGGYTIDLYAMIGPFSYSLLHAGWLHLVVNMVWLAAVGSPLANRIGWQRFSLFWFVTAALSALMYFLLHMTSDIWLIGASGSVSGMMGAAVRFGLRVERYQGRASFPATLQSIPMVFRNRMTAIFVLVWLMSNIVIGFGFSPPGGGAIAWEAHIGGFLAGFLLIPLFSPRARGEVRGA